MHEPTMQDLEPTSRGPAVVGTTAFLVLVFTTIYAATHHRFRTQKEKAYILSTISSGCMSAFSLVFVWVWIRAGSGFDAVLEGWVDAVARYGTVFFRSYLIADLLVGSFAFPKQIGILTGWIHHLAYIGIMVYLDKTRWSGLFMLAAIMEVPTFHLGLATLWPHLRNDALFLGLFLVTRILFHVYLILSFTIPSSLLSGLPIPLGFEIGKTGKDVVGSWMPGVLMGLAFPMHGMWFCGGVGGYLRRRRERRMKSMREAAKLEKQPRGDVEWDDGRRLEGEDVQRDNDYSPSVPYTRNDENNSATNSPVSCPAESLAPSSAGETPLLTPCYAMAALAGNSERAGGYFEGLEGVDRKGGEGLGLLVDGHRGEGGEIG